ncbi:MAG: prepilin-type N-terminal cleavage/methylation domain-containing protein [Planctomycetota bacterium]
MVGVTGQRPLFRPGRGPRRGFTFIEILVVMAMMGILMGIGIGYLTNIGKGSRTTQARAILKETAFRCRQSSNGGVRAILQLRAKASDPDALVVDAAVAESVLTHNFETLDFVSEDYPLEVEGKVESVADGYVGRAAKFSSGGRIVFEPQSAFAMTEGLSLGVWIRPEGGATTQTLLEAEGVYEVQLAQDPGRGGYGVRLKIALRDAGVRRSVPIMREFQTQGGPVRADGRTWTHLGVVYDGATVTIRINGLEVPLQGQKTGRRGPVTPGAGEGPTRQTIAIPEGGAVSLALSGTVRPYRGLMDSLVLGGVFRSSETEREIFGLQLLRPQLPVRVVYRNGRLDPDVHSGDVVLLLQDQADPEGALLELRLGLYGTIDDRLVWGSTAPSAGTRP